MADYSLARAQAARFRIGGAVAAPVERLRRRAP
jgi:hypothetical protein